MRTGQPTVVDRVGSVRPQKSVNGVIPNTTGYYPYGEEQQPTARNTEKFATYFRDVTGLDYANQRYYDSRLGRFLSPDPYARGSRGESPQSLNLYAYVEDDPVNSNDPTGENLAWMPGPADMGGSPNIGSCRVLGFIPASNPLCYILPGVVLAALSPREPEKQRPECTINFQCRDVFTSDSGDGGTQVPFLHGYLHVTSRTGNVNDFIAEGYTDGTTLRAWAKPPSSALPGDKPGVDKSAGSVTGVFVCDWVATLLHAVARVDSDRVPYNAADGPNSNTALYYFLSHLPRTMTPWFTPPSTTFFFRGFYEYPF